MNTLFGVRFLASEYSTGARHGGRMDSLGLDKNGSPVIFEYKRSRDENVISQGLFYFDWLMDYHGEFTLLVMKNLALRAAEEIDWSAPRLVCVASDFTRYDEYAVQQINRSIELVRYRNYGDDFLALELLTAITGNAATTDSGASPADKKYSGQPPSLSAPMTVTEHLQQAPESLRPIRRPERHAGSVRRRRAEDGAQVLRRLPAHEELRLRRGAPPRSQPAGVRQGRSCVGGT
nr:hypothetical protein [Actinoplanes sp. M2I2]